MPTKRKTTRKPEPIAVETVCSVCGLDWKRHGKNPTTDDCIRLLKQELLNRPLTKPYPYPVPVPVSPYPVPVPYREPWERERPYRPYRPYGPIWTSTPAQGELVCSSVNAS